MNINFSPQSLEEEIRQNIETIVTTVIGSVPLDRGFGLPVTEVDGTPDIAQARLTGQVMTAIAKYETRAEVTGVSFTQDHDRLVPIVFYRIKEATP